MATMQRALGNNFLKKYLKNKKYNTVINIGCRSDKDIQGMFYSDYFDAKKIIKVEPFPIKKYDVDYIAKCENLPFENSVSDMIFLHNVFLPYECDIDIEKSLMEMHRVLMKSGEVIISYSDFSLDAKNYLEKTRNAILGYFSPIEIYEYQTTGDRYMDKIVDYHVEIFCGKK